MLPAEFWQGVDEFNQQAFYACHDTLEALWMETSEPHKSFYQGILQIAVGCYHLENGNGRGAVILLGEGIRRLSSYQPEYEDIDVSRLLEDSSDLLQFLQQTEAEQLPEIVKGLKEEHFQMIDNRLICSLPKIYKSELTETTRIE